MYFHYISDETRKLDFWSEIKSWQPRSVAPKEIGILTSGCIPPNNNNNNSHHCQKRHLASLVKIWCSYVEEVASGFHTHKQTHRQTQPTTITRRPNSTSFKNLLIVTIKLFTCRQVQWPHQSSMACRWKYIWKPVLLLSTCGWASNQHLTWNFNFSVMMVETFGNCTCCDDDVIIAPCVPWHEVIDINRYRLPCKSSVCMGQSLISQGNVTLHLVLQINVFRT